MSLKYNDVLSVPDDIIALIPFLSSITFFLTLLNVTLRLFIIFIFL